ncbi:MAG: hypothetical protein JWM57_3546, partial [Phycisphaerales bacterium]|nr:hypothetical protein [Phycisphaerales bacterium]
GPPAAMATGLLARRVSAASLTMAFGPAVALTVWMVLATIIDRPAATREDRVIAYLSQHASPIDAVWADDYPRLLVETDRRPGSSVPLIFLMANGDAAPDFFGRQILSDWSNRQPAYVAFAADPTRIANLYRHHMADVASSPARADAIERQLTAMARYLAEHYRPEAEIDGVRIWRRGTAPADSVADTADARR